MATQSFVRLPGPISRDKVIARVARDLDVGESTVRRYVDAYEATMGRARSLRSAAMQERERWEYEATGVVEGEGN
jgi:transposase-like protein